jgi:4-aminobutyrate aminotransferase-like enzyme
MSASKGHRISSHQVLSLLRSYESRNVTCIEPDASWPMVWERARGVHVWDAEGKRYLDLTAAFGVAAAGHANPRVVKAGQKQMGRLLHAMGDVHPHRRKAQLARELSRLTFERWDRRRIKAQSAKRKASPTTGKTIFCNSGFEAVEAALKTALLATGKRGVIAFTGSYHGLGYGALNATHREFFRARFRSQLGGFARFVPFPGRTFSEGKNSGKRGLASLDEVEQSIRESFRQAPIGAILVEPVQGRGGIRIPPRDFLPLLRRLCDEHEALLIVDEIYTGFGRTGRWFACEHSETVPDVICLGKALTGGFPLSACVGRAGWMDAAWPESRGEALHTSTFLGHPVGCAMALAQIQEIETRKLVERSAEAGAYLLKLLSPERAPRTGLQLLPRGLGLMAGLELRRDDGSPAIAEVTRIVRAMLRRGFIVLPEGEHANVIAFTPPLTITEDQLESSIRSLWEVMTEP